MDDLSAAATAYFVFFGIFALIGGALTDSKLGAWTGFVAGPLGLFMILHAMLVKELMNGKNEKKQDSRKPWENV
ncbi:MAG: hypothetical protein OXC42_00695 [Gammaproteobacteria bacterium]|nr:hypothetical protein [Gammaproteobacteria bacterium]